MFVQHALMDWLVSALGGMNCMHVIYFTFHIPACCHTLSCLWFAGLGPLSVVIANWHIVVEALHAWVCSTAAGLSDMVTAVLGRHLSTGGCCSMNMELVL
jgi:hypothetical protein